MFAHNHPRKFAAQSLLVLALGAAIGVAGPAAVIAAEAYPEAHSDSVGAAITDTAITAKVKTRFAGDSQLHSSDISVKTTNGVVTLTGTADDASSAAASRMAQAVDGVKSVDNELTSSANPPKAERIAENTKKAVTDSWITTKVKSVLLADSVTKGLDVNVETHRGVVVLKGQLANHEAVDRVKELAQGVEGVKSVDTSGLMAGG